MLLGWAWVASATPPATVGRVLINEALVDPSGSDGGFEWVEIVNASGGPIQLEGWRLEKATQPSWGVEFTFPAYVLEPGQRLVIGETEVVEADWVVEGTLSLGNGSGGDGVRLVDSAGGVADTLVYGESNEDGIEDDVGLATSLAPIAPSGSSIARLPDAVDTDACGVDFQVLARPTPGLSNEAPAPSCGGPGSGVVVNELMPDPEGSDEGLEWIEIFHAGTEPVELEGWQLSGGTSPGGTLHTFGSRTLQPGEYLVVGGELVPEADEVLVSSLGNASSNADGVVLVDCEGAPSDVFVYGEVNEDDWLDEGGAPLASLAPKPEGGASLARLEDGYDQDDLAADVVVQPSPSPGAANPRVEPVVCVPSVGGVVINELSADAPSADDGQEWIELFNSGSSEARVDGWQLSLATKDFESIDLILPGGLVIAPGGFLVIGGELAPSPDVLADFSLGNGTGGDGVRLFDCEGSSVDTVVYGEDNADGLQDDLGLLAEAVPMHPESGSVGRVVDGVDTQDVEDWQVFAVPTPGASNVVAIEAVFTEEEGCGCGGGPSTAPPAQTPPTTAPGGGCRTAPFRRLAWPMALVGWALTRARRRRLD